MKRLQIGVACLAMLAASAALGSERCDSLRLAGIGTGEVTAATQVPAFMLRAMGFAVEIELGTPDEMYRRLAADEFDVLLRDGDPATEATAAAYRAAGQIAANGASDTRPGYAAECVSNATLMRRLSFPEGMEAAIMEPILRDAVEPRKSVKAWMRANRTVWRDWLHNVYARSGTDSISAVEMALTF